MKRGNYEKGEGHLSKGKKAFIRNEKVARVKIKRAIIRDEKEHSAEKKRST